MIRASDWLAFHADRTPDKLAVLDLESGQRLSYAQFNDRAGRLATFLRHAWGIQPGDRVAILGKNSADYFTCQFACYKLGAILLPLNWRLAEPELLFILNDAGARALLYDADFTARVAALAAESPVEHLLRLDYGDPVPDDNPSLEEAIAAHSNDVTLSPEADHNTVVTIMYTAGTTGHPKGALITHGMTFWNAVNISIPTGIHCNSVNFTVLPTFHTGGLNLYANPVFHAGGSDVVMRNFDAGLALQALADPSLGITHFFGVPAIYLFLHQHESFASTDLSGVQSWGCGGAPMPVYLLQAYAERGIIIQPGFGMTETSPTVFLATPQEALAKPKSVGKGVLHTRVRVVNDTFTDVAAGDVGELVISGPNVTPGYWNRPDANASSFTTDAYGYRWLHSGDAAMIDEAGCIYIVDRYKDMYISGGENVYPAEVEQVISQLDAVADSAVIGLPDAKWGEAGVAVVVLAQGHSASEDAVLAHCREHLARYKVPKRVIFVDILPRNAAGKVLKRALREQYASN